MPMRPDDAQFALGPVRMLQAAEWTALAAGVVRPKEAHAELERLADLEKKITRAGAAARSTTRGPR